MSRKHDHENTVTLPIRGIGLVVDAPKQGECACGGVSREEAQQMIQEALDSFAGGYELCEFYYFRHPTPRSGFQPCKGDVIAEAATLHPQAWEYLQTAEGQLLCKTEAEWQAMSQAVWHTNADGTKIGWSGVGGVPFFVQDVAAGTLRLPDLRGMYAEAAGFDSLGVGGVHGDGVPDIMGSISGVQFFESSVGKGAMRYTNPTTSTNSQVGSPWNAVGSILFNSARVLQAANKVQPRAWGALACVYLGQPAS